MNKNPINTSIKNGLIIISILSVLVGSIGVFWHWAGTVQDGLQEVVSGLHNNTQDKQKSKLHSMRQELRNSSKGISILSEASIDKQQVPDFLNQLEAIGGDNTKVHIKSVNINDDSGLLSVSIGFSGSFYNTVNLIDSVANITYVSLIDSLDIRIGEPVDNNSDIWDISIRIVVPLVRLDIK